MATNHAMTTTARADLSIVHSDNDPEPHYRTYTDADYQTAYHVWAGPAGRSLRRTAALLGISHTTLGSWSQRFDWPERYHDAQSSTSVGAARESDNVVQALIVAGQVPAILALHEIVADPGHKRRDVAAIALLALGGRPLPKAPVLTATRTLGDGTTISVKSSDLTHLSPTDLAHYARTGELPAGSPADTDAE